MQQPRLEIADDFVYSIAMRRAQEAEGMSLDDL
jgi:hypothetical protein